MAARLALKCMTRRAARRTPLRGSGGRWPGLVLLVTMLCAPPALSAAPQFCPRGVQVPSDGPALVVGVKFAPPFAMARDGKEWQGLAVDLWETIALCLGTRFEYREYAGVDELLAALNQREIDVAIGAIDIDPDRERRVDFTHAYYQGSLGVVVGDNAPAGGLAAALRGFMRPGVLLVVLGLGLATLLVAYVYWRVEGRRGNRHFDEGPARGFYNAVIWSTLLVFSGRGDPFEIQHRAAQLFVLFLTFFGVTIVSGVTAVITSALTLQGMPTTIRSVADLKGHDIAVMSNGRARDWSLRERLYVRQLRSWPEVQRSFEEKSIQAFVHDRDILQYLVKDGYLQTVRIEPLSFRPQGYGFAVPNGSPLREPINLALLAIQEDGVWTAMTDKYLGSR
jgi:polar amino acid transport system substrate-binding protein